MIRPFNIQEEPFEAYSEFDEELETLDSELADLEAELEGEEESRRGRRKAGRTISARSRPGRLPKRPPRPPKHRLPKVKVFVPPVIAYPPPITPPPTTPPAGAPPEGAPAAGAPPEAVPPTPEGSEHVRWLQDSLNRVLGLRLPVNGIMGPETRSAVRSFQERERLPVTGIAGPDTERALIAATASAPPSELEELELFDTEFADLEREAEVDRGSREYIRRVQRSLNQILGLRLAVDGIMGSQTRSAIRSFQQRAGLTMDGIVGPQTERALIAAGAGNPPGSQPALGIVPPSGGIAPRVSANSFLVGAVPITSPAGLNVTNYLDPRVHRFRNQRRRARVVNEFVVHETVTRSVADTVQVLIKRDLGVHLIMGPNGEITQHGDLLDDLLWHASQHNPVSVGIEVVNPYYPRFLKAGMPWTQVIRAGWAHEGRYVVPTPQQAEAIARLIAWITSSSTQGLSIPRTWAGLSGNTLAMGRGSGADRLKPGIYAHTYFSHADGAWLVLYAYLRLEKGRTPSQAYTEAIQLATTPNRFITVP
jgi:peptidoglycan hydrolase-like protein with peptidoglycan-binding domain